MQLCYHFLSFQFHASLPWSTLRSSHGFCRSWSVTWHSGIYWHGSIVSMKDNLLSKWRVYSRQDNIRLTDYLQCILWFRCFSDDERPSNPTQKRHFLEPIPACGHIRSWQAVRFVAAPWKGKKADKFREIVQAQIAIWRENLLLSLSKWLITHDQCRKPYYLMNFATFDSLNTEYYILFSTLQQ